MEYRENSLTYKEYIELRSSVGWNNFAKDQVIKAVNNGLYSVTVIENDAIIGMGRLIGDGIYYLIVDVVVKPEFQKRGIGSKIIDLLLAYVDDKTSDGGRASVQLIAEKEKENFYIKKAFKCIPHNGWDRDQTPVSQRSVIFNLYFFYNLISTQHLTVLTRGVILQLEQMQGT